MHFKCFLSPSLNSTSHFISSSSPEFISSLFLSLSMMMTEVSKEEGRKEEKSSNAF